MRTFTPKKDEIEKKWWVINAEGKTLGRLATEVAVLLRGKRKPEFAHFVDCGDFVVVINAEKVNVTGKKLEQKKYYAHSGYPGETPTPFFCFLYLFQTFASPFLTNSRAFRS